MTSKVTRKIVCVGSSFFVSIPIGFIRYFELSQGDKVEVITKSNIITIKPLRGGLP
jgi:hypothetical protein